MHNRFKKIWLFGVLAFFVSTWVCAIPHITPAAPQLSAKGYFLMDYKSGQVIVQKEAQSRIEPASLTKMMTMYVIDQELKHGKLKLTDMVPISKKAWKTEGSRMFVEVNQKVSVEELIKGIIIQSGNDACVAMAEYIAGSEETFATLMNHYAQQIGMKNSHFTNSTGLPDENLYTTVEDLAILAKALIQDFPDSYALYSQKSYAYNGIKQPNRNRLLWKDEYVDGIKTGHSSSAGYCLTASAEKDNMRLIAVVVGAQNDSERTHQTHQLLTYGFRFYQTHKLFNALEIIEEPRVWMGKSKNVSLGLQEDLYVTIPQGQYEALDAQLSLEKHLKAPITEGQAQGKLVVKLQDKLITQRPLVALEDLDKGPFWSRVADYVSLSIQSLFEKKDT